MPDPYYNETALLLNFDGANGSTTITDQSPHRTSVLTSGNAQLTTTGPKFGSACAVFDGSVDRLEITSPYLALGTRDFTIEFWVNPAAASSGSYARLFQLGSNTGPGGLWIVRTSTSLPMTLLIQVYPGSAYTTVMTSAATLPDGAWAHIALTRSDGVWRLFINGALDQTVSFTGGGNDITRSTLYIGSNDSGGESFAGKIDDLRVTPGIARYTAAFTAPTSAHDTTSVPAVTRSVSGAIAAFLVAMFSSVTQKLAPPPVSLLDAQHGGTGKIPGVVNIDDTPDYPVRRKVWLVRMRDAMVIRETWSDATTGAYLFTNIDRSQKYAVIAFDHTHVFNAVIADNITPEAM